MPKYAQSTKLFRGCPAIYNGQLGYISRVDSNSSECRNVWWSAPPEVPQIMFSLRRDGVWRAFPGAADGPGLDILDFLMG
jgi:hypothetical protein